MINRIPRLLVVGTIVISVGLSSLAASGPPANSATSDVGSLDAAQTHFYNARYAAAAELALKVTETDPTDLQAYELRTSAILFQVRRALDGGADKNRAFKACAICPDLIAAFKVDTAKGAAEARAQLKANPKDDNAQFYLGKLDLNHVWLYLGTLGKKTGWDEYWEGRHSLDAVLERNPQHLRARLARAWIDYIVDTRMTWGTRWILGGGNKKKALAMMHEVATTESDDYFARVEARFALWDVQIREKKFDDALASARRLAEDFPTNEDLTKFIEAHGP